MSTLLDPVWDAYQRGSDALKIVRRNVFAAASSAPGPSHVQGTRFDGLPAGDVDPAIDALQEDLDDRTVVSLFAAFEAEMFDHLAAQETHLRAHAAAVSPDFAAKLVNFYQSLRNNIKVTRVIGLFENRAAGTNLVANIRAIRDYRDWIAHGKRWTKPAQTSPSAAYTALNAFLSLL